MKLQYLSHSAFLITTDKGERILIDPFINGNPNAPCSADSLTADYIALTHAHDDHLGDAISIAKRCNATIIAVHELANYCTEQGCTAHNMHIGGAFDFSFGRLQFTIAHHGSSTSEGRYAGEPAGIVLNIDEKTIYHTGDTGLFMDMQLIGERNKIDYLLVPIGGNFTMDITDAIKAVEFTQAKISIPIHYNTFPIIAVNPQEFIQGIKKVGKKGQILAYGEEIVL